MRRRTRTSDRRDGQPRPRRHQPAGERSTGLGRARVPRPAAPTSTVTAHRTSPSASPAGPGATAPCRSGSATRASRSPPRVTGAPGFGTAVTSLSSYTDEGDDELCSQLVVGSPDESLRTGLQRSGVVYLYTWSATAKRFVLRATIEAPGTEWEARSQSGARFGAALAAEQRPADQIDPRPARLFVGAPGLDISDGPDTGQVTSFWVDADEDPDVHDIEFTRLGEPFTDEPTPGPPSARRSRSAEGKVAMGMPGFPTQDKAGAGAVLVDNVDAGPDGPHRPGAVAGQPRVSRGRRRRETGSGRRCTWFRTRPAALPRSWWAPPARTSAATEDAGSVDRRPHLLRPRAQRHGPDPRPELRRHGRFGRGR